MRDRARARRREYYDPYSGRGMDAAQFGWSAPIMEMANPDPRSAQTYLGSDQT